MIQYFIDYTPFEVNINIGYIPCAVLYPQAHLTIFTHRASLVAQTVKNLPAMWETKVQSLGRKDPLEKGIATYSSILAWSIP